MLTITNQKHNTIYYECSCGTKGMCSLKLMDHSAVIVVDLRCPVCKEVERITILQYDSEEAKEKLMKNINNIDLSWVPTINEEI